VTAYHQGIPAIAVLVAAVVLLSVAIGSFWVPLSPGRRETET